jgi:hypothetical protein
MRRTTGQESGLGRSEAGCRSVAVGVAPLTRRAGRVQGEPHAGERQYMEVLAVRSEAGCGSVADTNGPADEEWSRDGA